VRLDGSETAGSLHDCLAERGSKALLHCLQRLAAGDPPSPEPQEAEGICYARKLQKAEAEIDWAEPAALLERRVRAFNPWPVAWFSIDGERVRVWTAACLEQHHGRPAGDVLSADRAGIDVATGSDTLRLLELQPPGKRRMSAADFLNSRTLPANLASPR
jgi:methionyl-tRNA formyltransferase